MYMLWQMTGSSNFKLLATSYGIKQVIFVGFHIIVHERNVYCWIVPNIIDDDDDDDKGDDDDDDEKLSQLKIVNMYFNYDNYLTSFFYMYCTDIP